MIDKIILALVSSVIYSSKVESNPCLLSQSVAIKNINSTVKSNGFIIHENISYDEKSHWSDGKSIYKCLNNSSINKCCKPNEFLKSYDENRSFNCTEFSSNVPDLKPSDDQLADELRNTTLSNSFSILSNRIREICPNSKFSLHPEIHKEDEFVIKEDGKVYINDKDQTVFGRDQFCMDWKENFTTVLVLACYEPEPIKIQAALYPIGMTISILFLLATLLIYAVIPELKNLYGMTLMCYVSCLIFAYISLCIEPFIAVQTTFCTITAFVIHFSFLASFFWLNVMCFDLWWTFGGFRSLHGSVNQREKKKFIIYSIYAWGFASILTIICLIMDFHPNVPSHFIRPHFGEQSCWFQSDYAKAIYFYTPMGVTVLSNIILFISTALKISKHKKETAHQLKGVDSHRHDDNKQWFNLYLKLFIVMGINWAMEIISWLCKSTPDFLWYVTDLANTLQGVIIFIIFVWKNKIKRLLLKRIGIKNSSGFPSRNSTRSGFHSTASRSTCNSTMTQLQENKVNYSSTENNRLTTTDESDL